MSTTKVLPILMFSSLPASGKSESRCYLKSLSKSETEKFHLGDTSTQVDDYPYVDAMRKIDSISKKILGYPIFYSDETIRLFSGYDWGTLVYLINDDYFDIKKCNSKIPSIYLNDPVEWLFNRFDVASVKTRNLPARFFNLRKKIGEEKYNEFKKECYDICNTILKDKYNNIPNSLEGKTIVFEFSRGGYQGSSFPLKEPYGYEYSLSLFDEEILRNAYILYIWVTPEQSFNKNIQRGKEELEGKSQTVSTQLSLTHCVPKEVMIGEYGCDDFDYLINKSPNKNYLPIMKNDVEIHVKCGRFDNRNDLTSDFRKPQSEWTKEQIKKMEDEMIKAFDDMLKN